MALVEASFSVGELLESFVSMVAAISRLSDSTESRVMAENVQDESLVMKAPEEVSSTHLLAWAWSLSPK